MITRAITTLAQVQLSRDSVMATLIAKHGCCPLADSRYQPFQTLAEAIVGQQLSARAADTICSRVRKVVGGPLSPKRIQSAPIEQLREAGLSNAKASYLKELARRVEAREIVFTKMRGLSDEEVVEALVTAPGIGRWTAEMFLIFGLKRPNVLALGDVGLQRAAMLLYGDELQNCQHLWEPYKSIASWYLWRHLDG